MDTSAPPTLPPSIIHLYDEECWYIGDQNLEVFDIMTNSEVTMLVEVMNNDADSEGVMS